MILVILDRKETSVIPDRQVQKLVILVVLVILVAKVLVTQVVEDLLVVKDTRVVQVLDLQAV